LPPSTLERWSADSERAFPERCFWWLSRRNYAPPTPYPDHACGNPGFQNLPGICRISIAPSVFPTRIQITRKGRIPGDKKRNWPEGREPLRGTDELYLRDPCRRQVRPFPGASGWRHQRRCAGRDRNGTRQYHFRGRGTRCSRR